MMASNTTSMISVNVACAETTASRMAPFFDILWMCHRFVSPACLQEEFDCNGGAMAEEMNICKGADLKLYANKNKHQIHWDYN